MTFTRETKAASFLRNGGGGVGRWGGRVGAKVTEA